MPAVQAPAHILVTGASSFIGVFVIEDLLNDGYTVTGTVRSDDKGEYLKQLFSKHGDKFKYVLVDDVAKPGVFDPFVADVDGIQHIASPFHMKADDPQELIVPAVNGTLGVLKSAHAYGKKVKRVIVTSSVAAINNQSDPMGTEWTEADWNKDSPKEVEEKGKNASGGAKYQTSKTLAERAAWDFVKENGTSFDLATVNPSYVFGPTKHQVKSFDALNTSIQIFYDQTVGESAHKAKAEDFAASPGSCVDVRDVAAIHVAALKTEKAGGERYMASNGPFTWQSLLDELNDAGIAGIPAGKRGAGKDVPVQSAFGHKAERDLGIKFHTHGESAVATYNSLKERFPEAFAHHK